MTSRKPLLILFTLFFALSACGSPPPSPPPPPTTVVPDVIPPDDGPSLPTGNTALWVGWQRGPDSPNPFTAQWSESDVIFELVYSTLYRLHPDGTYVPDLVEVAEVSEDGKTWTFAIRAGVTFHDGEALTARDVAFSLNLYGLFREIHIVDETTLEIRLREPIPNMEGQLLHLYILPQHIWARYENTPDTFDNLAMIGSGPFRMAIYQQDSFVHLEAVSDHDRYPPKIEDIVYLVYEDENALATAIQEGAVDMIHTLPYSEIETLRNDPNVEVVTGIPLHPIFEEIIFNQLDPEHCPPRQEGPPPEAGGVCSGHPALRDRTVRLAMAHALDKFALIDQVLFGHGGPGVSIIPTGLETFFNSTINDYGYDPVFANQILDQAGYLDTDGDGVREMPDAGGDEGSSDEYVSSGQPGRPLRFRFNFLGSSDFYAQLSDLLSGMWGQIGIALDIQAMDSDPLTMACCPAFDYDIIVWRWEVDPEPGSVFDVMDTAHIPTGVNETGYSNPGYDILNAIQHTEGDEAKRLEALWDMQQIAHDDIVQIVLFYTQTVEAYRTDRFTGWITEASHLALEDFFSMINIEPVK